MRILGLFNIDVVKVNSPPIVVSLQINKQKVDMMVDTSAAVSLISEAVMNSLKGITLEKADIVLITYTAEKIEVLGKCSVLVSYGSQEHTLILYVVKGGNSCLLGRDWLSVLRLDWHSIALVQKSEEERVKDT